MLDAVAAGELHLTGVLMIAPHLTPENHLAVLARAKFRTKKELGRLIRDLSPLPNTPDIIEPLGPALARHPLDPTWEQFAAALAPEVRDLPAGERPGDWVEADHGNEGHDDAPGEAVTEDALPVGPAPADLPPITGPQLFQVQFGTVEEHVQLVERAKALLARSRPTITLGELHLEAMKLLVAALEKRKFAVNEPPRRLAAASKGHGELRHNGRGPQRREPPTAASRQSGDVGEAPCQRDGAKPPAGVPRQR